MSTYRSAKRDAAVADQFLEQLLACSFCGVMAPHSDLAAFGARCSNCFRAYCVGNSARSVPLSRAERTEMAASVKSALAGGMRASPRQHLAYLAEKVANGTATAGQRGFVDAARGIAAGRPVSAAVDQVQPPSRPAPPVDDDPPAWAVEPIDDEECL